MDNPLTQNIRPDRTPMSLKEYQAAGGYQGLRKAMKMSPQEVQNLVSQSSLRGRGGAGFPTGKKWSFMPMGPTARRPKYLCVNADEMEPGTMKDRLLLEGAPHELIEGALVSAYALEADVVYVFIRGEYVRSIECMTRAVAEAYEARYVGRNILGSSLNIEMRVHASAGRYMCGEETGLLNALEGKRATPRSKPPYPQVSGLWGQPTVVNNVETLCNIHHIVNGGVEWFKKLSRTDEGGTKLYGVSGRVKNPGVWEMPLGVTVREVIEGCAGGMRDGYKLRGWIPGGASTPFMPVEQLDVAMSPAAMEKASSRLGTGTIIVLDDRTCPVGMMLSLEKFFARESCGWCTPCREGLPWVVAALEALESGQGRMEDIDLLDEHTRLLGPGNTFCALAPGAMDPLAGVLKHLRADFEAHVQQQRCPWR